MQTLKTIVAAAVITLAATTVAVAGVGKVNGQNPTAPTPVPAVAAHQQQTQAGYALRLTDAQVGGRSRCWWPRPLLSAEMSGTPGATRTT